MNKKALRYRFSGFSLVELIVVMLISTLVVSFAYLGLSVSQQYFKDFEQKQQAVSHFSLLKKTLKLATFKSEAILRINDETMIFEGTSTLNVKLSSNKQFEFCSGQVCQTLETPIKSLSFYWKNEEQLLPNGPVDEVRVLCQVNNSIVPLSVSKKYDSKTLLRFHE